MHRMKQPVLILIIMIFCFTGLFDRLYQATPLPVLEETSGDYLGDIRERATYAYAAARMLNATVSLLESVEVGAVLSLQPGQVLEPINDMIEQFSDLILLALASVGVQEILIKVLGDISWTYLLPLALAPALFAPLFPHWRTRLNRLATSLVLAVLITRLVIPVIAVGGQAITNAYLRNDLNTALQHVEDTRKKTADALDARPKVSQPLPPEISAPKGSSVFSTPSPLPGNRLMTPNWETVRTLADSDKITSLLDNIPERIITLMTIFIFETLVWPLLVLFLFIWLGRKLASLL